MAEGKDPESRDAEQEEDQGSVDKEGNVEKEPLKEPVFMSITEEEYLKLQQDLGEYKDKYLRLLAETDNMRKRMQKERQELIQYAVQNLIVDFLTPIDQMENALKFAQQGSEEVKHWATGFQMVLNQFKDVLLSSGVVSVDSKGVLFDPHLHEAIEMVETPHHPEGTVVEESMRGYKMGDKTIRPARVKVAKSPSENEELKNNQQK